MILMMNWFVCTFVLWKKWPIRRFFICIFEPAGMVKNVGVTIYYYKNYLIEWAWSCVPKFTTKKTYICTQKDIYVCQW